MPAPRKHPEELRARAMRLVAEAREQDSALSWNAAVKRMGPSPSAPCHQDLVNEHGPSRSVCGTASCGISGQAARVSTFMLWAHHEQ